MSKISLQIENNLHDLRSRIKKQAKESARPLADVHLVAVSKRQSLERVRAVLEGGHRLFGENRVQEAMDRWEVLSPEYPDVHLHLIGALQTNKVRDAVALFDVIETVDRPKLVRALAAEMKAQDKFFPCFVQVNTGGEAQKSGVAPEGLKDLLECCTQEGLEITGLMCLPPVDEPSALHFAFLKKLAEENNLPQLSMGMSNDFEKAITLGATHIRVGTALFGDRDDNHLVEDHKL